MDNDKEDIYSNAVRAGKRTYFFDVKTTRGRDLYLTITESKKHTNDDGSATYEKHKIFLYKEDFDKFCDGIHDAIDEIDRLRATGDFKGDRKPPPERAPQNGERKAATIGQDPVNKFTDVDFDDLGSAPSA